MNSLLAQLADLEGITKHGYWGERIFHELSYATRLSKVRSGQYDDLIGTACQFLLSELSQHGAITRENALRAEDMIQSLSPEAKHFRMICAAHAHIDMNWMWRFDETVGVTLDTFRTMLNLMEEYPSFVFSQSQASTYEMVAQYAPEMLPEIRSRVSEGRWEVTASTWVEPDKNMPSGESLARHILYTKRYLSDLLGIDPDSLTIDFEPDTFGHSLHVPEILSAGGIKYYYHCRGYDGHTMYRWIAPSGAAVIVYREPIWYNAEIKPDMALYVPEFCTEHNMDTMLKVYGVGDHGGGPTRRDIERIIDMNSWPVFPRIHFGTFREYFSELEKVADHLPEVRGELNFVFSGCYTTQTRIKKANRIAEVTLNEAEMYETISSLESQTPYHGTAFRDAWKNVLFNQFHDIIPGSGVVDTREHAMGLFQQTMAIANTNRTLALRRIIGAEVETKPTLANSQYENSGSTSEGSGVGFGIQEFKIFQSERGRGTERMFHIFNATACERLDIAEIVVWDWTGDLRRMCFRSESGAVVEHQLVDHGRHNYWGHDYIKVLIQAQVPSCGYSSYMLSEDREMEMPLQFPEDPRVERPDVFVLENRLIRAEIDSVSGALVSLIDQTSGDELVKSGSTGGVFRFIQEDDSKGMTAWTVGRYMDIQELIENVRIRKVKGTGIRDEIILEMEFAHSKLTATISLASESTRLQYDVQCHWREVGGKGIPQLGFYLPLAYQPGEYAYDVPFGIIRRSPMNMDVPANSFAVAERNRKDGKSVMLGTDSKYGFRGTERAVAVTLIRSSFDPDPYPEFGVHTFSFFLSLVDGGQEANHGLILQGSRFNHPLSVLSGHMTSGAIPASRCFFSIEKGSVSLSAFKIAEDMGETPSCMMRLYETSGVQSVTILRFSRKVKRVHGVDLNERLSNSDVADLVVDEKGRVTFTASPFKIVTLFVELE